MEQQPQAEQQQRKEATFFELVSRIHADLLSSDQLQPDQLPSKLDLWRHFNQLPFRYIDYINLERYDDILLHVKLLNEIRNRPAKDNGKPAFAVRPMKMDGRLFFGPRCEVICSTDNQIGRHGTLTSMLEKRRLEVAHQSKFSTVDGFCVHSFVVHGWPTQHADRLKQVLEEDALSAWKVVAETVPDDPNAWELDTRLLKRGSFIGSGSFEEVYRGQYGSQVVAIKILKAQKPFQWPCCFQTSEISTCESLFENFDHEVEIMKRIRHQNVVQFIGACTQSADTDDVPELMIVTELMDGGSVEDYYRKNGPFKLAELVKAALDISEGMQYLHDNSIIHRDLKCANLLRNKNGVVKIADFGLARVKETSGAMSEETGTYKWMAPEVAQGGFYSHKADVFSFGIVMWEMLEGKAPYPWTGVYEVMRGVAEDGLRPKIPEKTPTSLADLLERCWHHDPDQRPEFSAIIQYLQNEITDELEQVNE